ncbi:MAG: hypothetical protein K2O03_11690 [Lachnospiraceae bacterium]|nr:hypothetical protein [Lachnospiraceae bacterium]
MELEKLREELVKRLGGVVALLEAKDYSAASSRQLSHDFLFFWFFQF